jgi:hypothetical protein
VDDTLPVVAETKVCEAKCLDIVLESGALCSAIGFFNKCVYALEVFTGGGGNILW